MTDQPLLPEEPVVTQPTVKRKTGFIFFLLIILIMIGGFGYGFFQLSKVNMNLARIVNDMQQRVQHTQNETSSLKSSLTTLQTQIAQVQETLTQQSKALTDLHAAPTADNTDLYLELNTLNSQIDQLPLPQTPLQPTPAPVKSAENTTMPWWKVGMQRSWEALQQIIVIRDTRKTPAAFLVPQEKNYLYQNLHAQIESAMWAVQHHNEKIYQASLDRARDLTQQYFLQDSAATKAFLESLSKARAAQLQQ